MAKERNEIERKNKELEKELKQTIATEKAPEQAPATTSTQGVCGSTDQQGAELDPQAKREFLRHCLDLKRQQLRRRQEQSDEQGQRKKQRLGQ